MSWPHAILSRSPVLVARCSGGPTGPKQTLRNVHCSKAMRVLAWQDSSVTRSSTPLGVPGFGSNGNDQMSLLISKCVNARESPVAQDGSTSFPAPTVNLLNTPLTFPVSTDIPVSQRLRASPLSRGEDHAARSCQPTTWPGNSFRTRVEGWLAKSRVWNPARTNASYAPVLTGLPPFIATSHQSMAELSYAFPEVYPIKRRCLPSGDQIGKRAAVKFDPTCRGCPPATGTTQTAPLPGTTVATLSSPIQ